jgi:5-methyltetrahydrofolate--homocysteine methyltransferase
MTSDSKIIQLARERVVFLDGAMGTALHERDLPLSDYNGLENCSEVITLTRPDVIADIHSSFLDVGCDAVETNTFGGMKHVLSEFDLTDRTYEINLESARIARAACDKFSTPQRPRFVVGSMGPGTKLPTLRQIDWDTVLDSYAEQTRGLLDGGADALLIETCQDILQAKAAMCGALTAMREKSRALPIMIQVTMETFGTMLVGTDVSAAFTALDAYPQVEVIGFNCATGPQEMSEHVRFLSQHSNRLLSVVPNAGLPQLVDGRPHYALTPEELARWLKEFVEVDGVNIVGGCCGTTPEHMRAVIDAIGMRPPVQRQPQSKPAASSIYSAATIEQDSSFLIIGERTNTNGSRRFKRLLDEGNLDGMVQMAREQMKEGAHVLDVCGAFVGRDEEADMNAIIDRFTTEVSVPLMIDSTEPNVLESCLKLAGGKCIINSINLEDGEGKLDLICQLARTYGAALVALTIDEDGMAKELDEKIAVARRIHDLCVERHGIRSSDLIFDPLTFTICTGNEDDRGLGRATLESIREIKAALPGVHTVLGLSNISFGLLPAARSTLNSVYLHHALEHGLDAAIVHAAGIQPFYKIEEEHRRVAEDLIYDRRKFDDAGLCTYDPLQALIKLFSNAETKPRNAEANLSIEERLKNRIIDGDRNGLPEELDRALQTHTALDIINDILLDGMKVVGELFGSGQMQLPFVLQSAETMKSAVAHLEPHMDKIDGSSKGRIVLATVKGDVHDIGKNLVDIILTNNGYEVFNLGIKQPINAILEKTHAVDAHVIGMSGLLVKSTVIMKDNLEVMNERDIEVPVILGGAALTRRYVEEDLRAIYRGRLDYAKDAFEGLALMEQVAAGDTAPRQARSPAPRATKPVAATTPLPQRSDVDETHPIPEPPFWGRRLIDHVPVPAVLGFMNEVMLFQVQWQYKRARRPEAEYRQFVESHVRPIYRELVARCQAEEILRPRAIYGYWPCAADRNRLIVYDPDVQDRELTTFEFPRSRHAPHRCIADFFRTVDSGQRDVLAMSIVTMGRQVSEIARAWFEADRYKDYLHLHGLGVECAEALAEYVHKQIRVELGIAGHDARELRELFKQGYQGSRYSFGYPACPNLEDHAKMWPLLQPEDIDVTLSEEWQLDPEQSTSALICHHPQARYFNAR